MRDNFNKLTRQKIQFNSIFTFIFSACAKLYATRSDVWMCGKLWNKSPHLLFMGQNTRFKGALLLNGTAQHLSSTLLISIWNMLYAKAVFYAPNMWKMRVCSYGLPASVTQRKLYLFNTVKAWGMFCQFEKQPYIMLTLKEVFNRELIYILKSTIVEHTQNPNLLQEIQSQLFHVIVPRWSYSPSFNPRFYTSSYTITICKLLVSPVCIVHSFSHMISCLGFAIYYLLLGLEGSIALFITMQQAGSYILPKMFVGPVEHRRRNATPNSF